MFLKKRITLFILLIFAASLYNCAGPSRTVSRVQVDKQIDISGHWNDSDARMTAQVLVRDVLSKPWLDDFKEENDRKPVVIVGRIRNKSSEHINTLILINDMEKELINSGRVKFVASKKQRDEIRNERMDQQSYSSVESAKELANEQAADFMLQGTISSVTDAFEGKKVVLYKVDLELIDIENNTKVWMGDKEIKKFIQQDKYSW